MDARTIDLAMGLIASVCLSACAAAVDVRKADLMPDSVARSVAAKYLGAEWVSHPYMLNMCADDRISISYQDVVRVDFVPAFNEIFITNSSNLNPLKMAIPVFGLAYQADMWLNCRSMGRLVIYNATREQSKEVADALASLGARLTAW